MGLRTALIGLEEAASRECTVTFRIVSGKERELFVENCRRIISCDNDFITLGICKAVLRIGGVPLVLENFGVGGVKISGSICSLEIIEADLSEN